MTNNQFYYLMLVLIGFGSFAVAMAVATLQYKAWLRRSKPAAFESRTHRLATHAAVPAAAD